MSKSWGTPTWIFFHVLIEKINPEQYNTIKQGLLNHIKKICALLPCPDCAQHATQYMKQFKYPPPTKEDFKQLMYHFHNTVNVRTRKQVYNFTDMTIYERYNLTICYQIFRHEFTKKTFNPRLFIDSMSRNKYTQELDQWLITNKLI
jgi:hypothetical protein